MTTRQNTVPAQAAPAVPPARPRPGDQDTAATRAALRLRAAARLPARVLHGRPARLTARTALAAAAGYTASRCIPGTPAAAAIQAATALWLITTARTELAPPARRQTRPEPGSSHPTEEDTP